MFVIEWGLFKVCYTRDSVDKSCELISNVHDANVNEWRIMPYYFPFYLLRVKLALLVVDLFVGLYHAK